MATTKQIQKMSTMVIECELRQMWSEIECSLRHGHEPSKRVSDYTAALTKELNKRS